MLHFLTAEEFAQVHFPMSVQQSSRGGFAFPDDLQVGIEVGGKKLTLNLTKNFFMSQETTVSTGNGLASHTLKVTINTQTIF